VRVQLPLLTVLWSGVACAQLVCGGTTKECQERQEKICAAESAPANLLLPVAATVSGTLKDASAAPFKQVPLSLRSVPNDRFILSTKTDEDGTFNLGHLEFGQYRLIMLGGAESAKPKRIGFDQPTEQTCEDSPECIVHYVLRATATDQAVSFCPPK